MRCRHCISFQHVSHYGTYRLQSLVSHLVLSHATRQGLKPGRISMLVFTLVTWDCIGDQRIPSQHDSICPCMLLAPTQIALRRDISSWTSQQVGYKFISLQFLSSQQLSSRAINRPCRAMPDHHCMLHHAWQSSCGSTCTHAPRSGAGYQRSTMGMTVTTTSHDTCLCISHSHSSLPNEDGPVVTKARRWLRLLSRHRSLIFQHVSHYGILSPDSFTCMTHPPGSLPHVNGLCAKKTAVGSRHFTSPPMPLLPAS